MFASLIRPIIVAGLVLAPAPWPGLDAPPAAWADDHDGGNDGDDGGDDDGDRGDGNGDDRDDDDDRGDDDDDGRDDDGGGRNGGGDDGRGDRGGGSRGAGGDDDDDRSGPDGDDDGDGRGASGGSSDDDRGRGRGGGDDDDDDDDDDDADRAADRRDDLDDLSDIPEAQPSPRGAGRRTLGQALRGMFRSEPSEGREVVQGEFLGLDLSEADLSVLATRGFATLSSRPLGGLGLTVHRFRAPPGVGLRQALSMARRTVPGATFDYNHLYPGTGAGCVGPTCWAAALTNISALPPDACGRGAPVAIIDTSVDVTHPALAGARIERRSFLPLGSAPAPSDHGTAVAALLVGRLSPDAVPLAPGATLLAAEAFAMQGDAQRANAAAVIAALDWALERDARVISLSLAGAPNLLLGRAVAIAATRANLVAAAGNGGPDADPAYPAAYPEVTAVAAVDRRKRPWSGGNRGDYVELAAPGVDVVSAAPHGALARWTGTSFATPFAAAALLRARAIAGGDPEAARRALARAAEDIGTPGRDPLSGHGLVRSPGPSCW